MLLGLDGLCIGNGILTVENHAQAAVRADPAGPGQGRRRGGGGAAPGRARPPLPPGAPLPEAASASRSGAAADGGRSRRATAAQARRMRSAARFYAVQALFQMEAADAGLETVLAEFEDAPARRRDRRRDLRRGRRRAFPRAARRGGGRAGADRPDDRTGRWSRAGRSTASIRRCGALFRAAGAELVATDTPPKVTITEYLDVAKAFYPEGKEAKFVNGVLDHMAREAQPQAFA